jgi:hypothetical protein
LIGTEKAEEKTEKKVQEPVTDPLQTNHDMIKEFY